jgi:glycosyltransferase involved in cell wall biosynthesis
MTAASPFSARHRFIVPGAGAGVSGGNLYNREFLAACARAGASVEAIEVERAPELLRAADSGFFWLDTLYLDHWATLRAIARTASLGLLVHYLPSLVEHGDSITSEELSAEERLALAGADAFIVTCAWMAAALRRLGGSHRPYLTVEPGRPESSAQIPPAPSGGVRAVLVANLLPGKAILPFLRALSAELTVSDRLELTIVGGSPDPAYAESCRTAVAGDPRLSARVGFAGELAHAAAVSRIASSNLFVSSSYFEAYAMALCEARVAGLPIVARSGGNTAAWADPDAGGELCSDDRALARAVVRLCRQPALHAERLERARAARPLPRSWSRAAEDFIFQAQRLADSRRRPEPTARGTTSEKSARTTR